MGKAAKTKRYSKAWAEQPHYSTHSAARFLSIRRKRTVASNTVQAGIERGDLVAIKVVGLDEHGKPTGRVQYAIPESELLAWKDIPERGRPMKRKKLTAGKVL